MIDVGGQRFRFFLSRASEVDDGNVRVDWADGTHDVWVPAARVRANRTVLHQVAPIETDCRFRAHACHDDGGLKVLRRLADAFSDLAGQDPPKLPGDLQLSAKVFVEARAARHERPRMGVRGTDHDVAAGDAGLLLDQLASFAHDFVADGNQVACHQRGTDSVFLKDQRLGMKVVKHTFRQPERVRARHRHPYRRCDDDRRPSDSQIRRSERK